MKPEFIIIHTAAHGDRLHNGDTSAEQIDNWHKERGWRGIGYHHVVRLDGTLETGRPEDQRGAHCTSMGMNSKSIGICFSGHGDYHPWTEVQEKAGILLIASIAKEHHIPIQNIMGHRETGAKKTCPGHLIDMTRVRNLVEAIVDSGVALLPEPGVDFTGMFRSICDIFDDPNYQHISDEAKVNLKALRYNEPFDEMNREDL